MQKIIGNAIAMVILIPAVLVPGTLAHFVSLVIGVVFGIYYGAALLLSLSALSAFITVRPEASLFAEWYPVLVNSFLALLFSYSLTGVPLIERIARQKAGADLDPSVRRYCKRLTLVWILFFLLNGGIAAWTVVSQSYYIWALYNGGLSYVLAGSLFFGEKLLRSFFVDTTGERTL